MTEDSGPRWPNAFGDSNRPASILAILLVMSAFGPYVASGIRTEQAMVYGLAPLLLTPLLPLLRPPAAFTRTMLPWLIYVVIVCLGALAPPQNTTGYLLGSAFAGADNAVLPLAVMAIALVLAMTPDPVRPLRAVATTLALAMCFNAAVALAQVGGMPIPGAWQASSLETTADRAASLGRFSGLINQPAEAGALYGLAVMCAIYRFRDRTLVLTGLLTLLGIGGFLTVSKVFLLGALPLGLILLSGERKGLVRIAQILGLIGVAWLVSRAPIFRSWTGSDALGKVLPEGSESWVDAFGSSRYGESSTLTPIAEAVLGNSPWFGFGAGGLRVAYDSQWLESLAVGGIIGLLLVFFSIGNIAVYCAKMEATPEKTLLIGALGVLVVASLGIPSFTANRVATCAWLILTLAILASEARRIDLTTPAIVEPEDHIRPRNKTK